MKQIIPEGKIEQTILLIRGQKVMVDADLASLYGVTIKRLREQVRRNLDRFPDDFMFSLTKDEQLEVAANCGHLNWLKFSRSLPYVFTEHGAIMLASVLNSKIAVQASIHVVRAFARLREILASHKDLAKKMAHLEKKYDHQFKVIFDTIRQLMASSASDQRKIGF